MSARSGGGPRRVRAAVLPGAARLLVLWLVVAAVAPVGPSRARTLPSPGRARAETSTARFERARPAREGKGARRWNRGRRTQPARQRDDRRRSRRPQRPRRGGAHPSRRPDGSLRRLPGGSTTHGDGDVVRFVVEVERHLRASRSTFLRRVEATLFSPRGWLRSGDLAFRRARRAPVDVRIVLASPATTDRLCAPARTLGRLSCHNDGLVVINAWRWKNGAPAYRRLSRYRTYVVNHEVGHALGHGHLTCSGTGAAPVMMQQTIGVDTCRANPWPLRAEVGGG